MVGMLFCLLNTWTCCLIVKPILWSTICLGKKYLFCKICCWSPPLSLQNRLPWVHPCFNSQIRLSNFSTNLLCLCSSFHVAILTWIVVCQAQKKATPRWNCPSLRSCSYFWHQMNQSNENLSTSQGVLTKKLHNLPTSKSNSFFAATLCG